MVIDTFKPGKVQAVLVFKASNNETGLLWIPKFCVKQHCQTGLQNYNLGDWLIFNMTSQRVIEIVRDVEVPYETRLYSTQENDQFVEVCPILSDKSGISEYSFTFDRSKCPLSFFRTEL
jgi:hypothetical protein